MASNRSVPRDIFEDYGLNINDFGGEGHVINITRGGNIEDVNKLAQQLAATKTQPAIDAVADAYQKRQTERNRIVAEFQGKNPFVFDEVLAQKATLAKEQLDPYYNQTLNDFLTGIERTKTRSVEDQQRLLGELSQDVGDYTDQNKELATLAIERAREGRADAGLLQSGATRRQEGLLQLDQNQGMQDFMTRAKRREGDVNLSTERGLADLQRQEQLGTRDINREREAQQKILAGNLAKEEGVKYSYALRQSLGSLADENTQGDVLAGLGIYS